jgi:hypothetical protein
MTPAALNFLHHDVLEDAAVGRGAVAGDDDDFPDDAAAIGRVVPRRFDRRGLASGE